MAVVKLTSRCRDDSKIENRMRRRRKWRAPDVFVFLLMLIANVTRSECFQEQRFAMEPQDQNAIVGTRVTLPCRVENRAGIVQWTKDDFGLGIHRNLTGFDRYSMIGSDEEADFSLDIQDVTLEDDGLYQCQVSAGYNGESELRSRYAKLTVLAAPDPPRIIQGAFIDATENKTIDIECVSSGGKPAAEIIWVDGQQIVINNKVTNIIEKLPDGQTYITRSMLRLTPNKKHHNQTITCQAQNTADRAPRMATVHIEVKYAPKINLTVLAENGTATEGTETRIRCDVDSNPAPQWYRWYLNENLVTGDYNEEMIIFNTTRDLHRSIVTCEVNNSVGKSEAHIILNVKYPPTFRSRPHDVEAELGAYVDLNCDVDGQPKPVIRWLLNEPGRIGVKGKTPTLKMYVNSETAGRYICKATVEGYPEIETEATVFIKGTPRILSNRTQFGSEGEIVRVECTAVCVPKPDDIRWYFEGREISAVHDPDYATLEETLPGGVIKTSLVIRASQSKHYGLYNCSVTNEYGNANAAILLKPLKTLPLFIILVGVTSGIIIFSAFIVLLFICHRRRKNKMNEKPDVNAAGDMYKESDRSSNISDLKLQIPQSEGSYELEYTSSERSSKLGGSGLPLAGPVPLPHSIRHDDALIHLRYTNDYSDPAYNEGYYKQPPSAFIYDYPQGYAPPPNLRVQSPAEGQQGNRSHQGSLTRSIDTASTLPLSTGNGSRNNSLKRLNTDDTDAINNINNLGLPLGSENTPTTTVYAQLNPKPQPGVDLRYSATYGNPYLRNSSHGYNHQINTAKPATTPAPPPYSSLRNSAILSAGTLNSGNQKDRATNV